MALVGHEDAWQQWRDAQSGPRMHHAWLLAGKQGLGKAHFAVDAARELVAEPGSPPISAPHPDIITLTNLPKDDKEAKKRDEGTPFEAKRNISVAQIREMQKRLNTRPTLGDRRVIIIDPADDLEKSASNALLKSLEEPPAGTYFVLVAHRPARLLPTIRSRCRVLRFASLTDVQLGQIVSAKAPDVDASTRDAAIALAGGSPGAALEFVEHNLGALDRLLREISRSGDSSFTLRGQLSDTLGARPGRDRILTTLNVARGVLAAELTGADKSRLPGIIEAHSQLVKLGAQAPTYNFDAGLLIMEIGSLLAKAANPSEAA
ncbi:AAA family ATPase [Altererythrobacter aquiaggeris]|uniref:AAA family ATPase n=1 Tax=Aestuarierythrobacter aquiaggeris TaxID=1898396 RepID=UPI00301933A2